jgi:hypothetical protein
MSGAIPPLSNTPSWHGAQLKHKDNFTFTLSLFLLISISNCPGFFTLYSYLRILPTLHVCLSVHQIT